MHIEFNNNNNIENIVLLVETIYSSGNTNDADNSINHKKKKLFARLLMLIKTSVKDKTQKQSSFNS